MPCSPVGQGNPAPDVPLMGLLAGTNLTPYKNFPKNLWKTEKFPLDKRGNFLYTTKVRFGRGWYVRGIRVCPRYPGLVGPVLPVVRPVLPGPRLFHDGSAMNREIAWDQGNFRGVCPNHRAAGEYLYAAYIAAPRANAGRNLSRPALFVSGNDTHG